MSSKEEEFTRVIQIRGTEQKADNSNDRYATICSCCLGGLGSG